jgi:hypothetical protein
VIMRRVLFLAFVLMGAGAYACDSFEEGNAAPPIDAGAAETSAPDVASDVASDVAAPCEGEPEWAYPGGPVPTVATCNDVSGVDLLTSAEHCGRCAHSCGAGGSCKDGLCEVKQEDPVFSVPGTIADGVLYYSHRPLFAANDVMRLAPGQAPVLLGTTDGDGGAEREILSLAVAGDALYVRTKQSLRRTSKTQASNALPELVTTLSNEETATMTLAPDGKLIVSAKSERRYDALTTTGQLTTLLPNVDFPLEAAFAKDRFVWMSQPFHYFGGSGSSVLRIREGGTDRVLLESAQPVGGLVIDGEQAFVIRNSSTGGSILAIDLKDGVQHSLFDGALTNVAYQLTLAVDATHVYWVKSLDGAGVNGEIWKRARCGGAAVRIASHGFIFVPQIVGDRIYFGANDGLYSLAK